MNLDEMAFSSEDMRSRKDFPSTKSTGRSPLGALLALSLVTVRAFAAVHPLEPLSTNEICAAVDALLKESKVSTNTLFPIVALREPPKEQVLAWQQGQACPRQASVTTYELASHRTHEAVVDLDQGRVAQWRHLPGVEPLQTEAELEASARILESNDVWVAALKRRGLTNLALVDSSAVPTALVRHRGAGDVRLLRAAPFLRTTNRLTWEPIEGLSAVVDMTHRRALTIMDRDLIPRSTSATDIFDPAVRGWREGLKPLITTQPQGASFLVRDHAVSWDHWRFRYALHPREGLVLYQIGWEESPGRVRPILYRASVSDLVAFYGDPDEAWSWRTYFDESDFGLGYCAAPLIPGVTTVAHATLLSEPLPNQVGGARNATNVVDIYERDAGSLWAHYETTSKVSAGPRARELVIGYLTAIGNYDYRFQWSFRQDGMIEFHVYLTGIMQLKGTHAQTCKVCAAIGTKDGTFTAPGEQAHGVLVADHLLAPHHQHFFSLRLDFDVDGTRNSVKELNLTSNRPSSRNPRGNSFSLHQTVFARERQAVRDLNPASHRRWAVFNPNSISALGHPAAYMIESDMNTVPFLAKDSPARKRTGFTDHHFFATHYGATELYAGGDYPVTAASPNNVLTWTRDNERIQNEDVVAWYTLGVTHIARPEEFPVMPTAHASVRLVPTGFFSRNPVLDVPDSPVAAANPADP
jgi:primary-amine oxidase